jgi:hypothetical protein
MASVVGVIDLGVIPWGGLRIAVGPLMSVVANGVRVTKQRADYRLFIAVARWPFSIPA